MSLAEPVISGTERRANWSKAVPLKPKNSAGKSKHVYATDRTMIVFAPRWLDTVSSASRDTRSGTALISAITSIVLLLGLLMVIQARLYDHSRVLAAIAKDYRADMIDQAVHAVASGHILLAAYRHQRDSDALDLNGKPFDLAFAGETRRLRVQDVEGLVDVFLASPAQLEALGVGDAIFLERRSGLSVEERGRIVSTAQALSVLGLPAKLDAVMTIHGQYAQLNWPTLSKDLEPQVQNLTAAERMDRQPKLFRVRLERIDLQ